MEQQTLKPHTYQGNQMISLTHLVRGIETGSKNSGPRMQGADEKRIVYQNRRINWRKI
jgi:hypothetical protein